MGVPAIAVVFLAALSACRTQIVSSRLTIHPEMPIFIKEDDAVIYCIVGAANSSNTYDLHLKAECVVNCPSHTVTYLNSTLATLSFNASYDWREANITCSISGTKSAERAVAQVQVYDEPIIKMRPRATIYVPHRAATVSCWSPSEVASKLRLRMDIGCVGRCPKRHRITEYSNSNISVSFFTSDKWNNVNITCHLGARRAYYMQKTINVLGEDVLTLSPKKAAFGAGQRAAIACIVTGERAVRDALQPQWNVDGCSFDCEPLFDVATLNNTHTVLFFNASSRLNAINLTCFSAAFPTVSIATPLHIFDRGDIAIIPRKPSYLMRQEGARLHCAVSRGVIAQSIYPVLSVSCLATCPKHAITALNGSHAELHFDASSLWQGAVATCRLSRDDVLSPITATLQVYDVPSLNFMPPDASFISGLPAVLYCWSDSVAAQQLGLKWTKECSAKCPAYQVDERGGWNISVSFNASRDWRDISISCRVSQMPRTKFSQKLHIIDDSDLAMLPERAHFIDGKEAKLLCVLSSEPAIRRHESLSLAWRAGCGRPCQLPFLSHMLNESHSEIAFNASSQWDGTTVVCYSANYPWIYKSRHVSVYELATEVTHRELTVRSILVLSASAACFVLAALWVSIMKRQRLRTQSLPSAEAAAKDTVPILAEKPACPNETDTRAGIDSSAAGDVLNMEESPSCYSSDAERGRSRRDVRVARTRRRLSRRLSVDRARPLGKLSEAPLES